MKYLVSLKVNIKCFGRRYYQYIVLFTAPIYICLKFCCLIVHAPIYIYLNLTTTPTQIHICIYFRLEPHSSQKYLNIKGSEVDI